MVRAIGPLMSIKAQKQLGHGLIYKQKGSRSLITRYNKPGGQNRLIISPTQLNQRMLFNLLIARWQTFTAGQKATWNDDPRTKTLRISGWNLFYREALKDLPTYLGLQGYWSFNRIVGGKILDLSGNGYDGDLKPVYPTNYPQLVNSIGPKFGKAGSFDGVDDYVLVSNVLNFSSRAPFTLECWFNSGSPIAAYPRLINRERYSPTRDGYNLYLYKLGVQVGIERWIGGTAKRILTAVSYNIWNHAVATYDGNQLILYLNGVDSGQIADARAMTTFSANLVFGIDNNLTNEINGLMDEVRIYNRALSATEIQKHYELISKK